jgi:hypothetical protein
LDIHDEHMKVQEKRNDDVMMINLNNYQIFINKDYFLYF